MSEANRSYNSFINYYFLGIGGIGMSAIARYLKDNGREVFGYDRVRTELCHDLEKEGILITYQDLIETLPELVNKNETLIVYTPAIPEDSILLNHFRGSGYTVKKRSELLGEITHSGTNISIAGTHGKTTTSSLVAYMLKNTPTRFCAFLGGISTNLGSNYFNSGNTEENLITLTEADEFDRSFLTLDPNIAVVTSMDADHLDIYGTDENIKSSFNEFIKKIKPGGTLFLKEGLNISDANDIKVVRYGIESGDLRAENLRVENGDYIFDLIYPSMVWPGVKLALPGNHNVENALAAIGVCLELRIDKSLILYGLANFKGVKRRFEYIIKKKNFIYIDDYAHHPTELKAFIESVRFLYPDKKLTGIFQPHLFSRTRDFAEGFARSLDLLDKLYLLEIYPAREKPIPGIRSSTIFDLLKLKDKVLTGKTEVIDLVKRDNPEVLLTIGAGDIDTLVPVFRKMFENEA
ncbi:MAG: UDP-N-acetylmuramate--L-alanine ligase [Flavobacteriales bacterium]|nr:UDP-N-acetylmuramate--L-alanine ligase [Flavobacteriales bacterium]